MGKLANLIAPVADYWLSAYNLKTPTSWIDRYRRGISVAFGHKTWGLTDIYLPNADSKRLANVRTAFYKKSIEVLITNQPNQEVWALLKIGINHEQRIGSDVSLYA